MFEGKTEEEDKDEDFITEEEELTYTPLNPDHIKYVMNSHNRFM